MATDGQDEPNSTGQTRRGGNHLANDLDGHRNGGDRQSDGREYSNGVAQRADEQFRPRAPDRLRDTQARLGAQLRRHGVPARRHGRRRLHGDPRHRHLSEHRRAGPVLPLSLCCLRGGAGRRYAHALPRGDLVRLPQGRLRDAMGRLRAQGWPEDARPLAQSRHRANPYLLHSPSDLPPQGFPVSAGGTVALR